MRDLSGKSAIRTTMIVTVVIPDFMVAKRLASKSLVGIQRNATHIDFQERC